MTSSASQVARGIAAILLLAAGGTSVGAQVLEPPPRTRPARGRAAPDPTAARYELATQLNVLGGWDDHLAVNNAVTAGIGSPLATPASGYLGFTDAAMRYWLGRRDRSLELRGHGFMHTYRNLGLIPAYGGDINARGHLTFARANELSAAQLVRWDPFFALATMSPGRDSATLADPSAINALQARRSRTSDSTVTLSRNWTRMTTTTVTYTFNQHSVLSGPQLDGRTHVASALLGKAFGRSSGLHAAYRHSDAEFTSSGRLQPTVDDTLDVGLYYDRGISPTRRMAFSGGGGALHVETISALTGRPTAYTTPSAYGTARVDVGRTWGIGGDYRRGVSVLQGTGVDSFVVHNGGISVGGFMTDRLETTFSALYSNGRTGPVVLGQVGSYDGYTGAVQIRLTLTRWWSAVANINHYQFRLNSIASASVGAPPQMDRNSVRIGFTWAAPLGGSRTPRPTRDVEGRD